MPLSDETLAAELGFSSAEQMRRVPRSPRSLADFVRIPADARAIRSGAAVAVATARHQKVSVQHAAREAGVPLEAISWWFPDAVVADADGELHVAGADSATRLRPLAVDGEVTFVPVDGWREAHRAAELFDVQWRFVTGRATPEEVTALPDVRVAGRRLERDPDVLTDLALRGDFDLDDIYRDLFG